MPDIADTVEKISATLAERGALSSITVLEELRKSGVSAEQASTAIAAGSQRGVFVVDAAFRLVPEGVVGPGL